MLFESTEPGQFADVARPLGCDAIEDSRGVAIADLNNDGQLDIVINNNNGIPAIYLNQLGARGNWLRVDAVGGPHSNRDAIGTSIQLVLDIDGQERKLTRWIEAGTGYSAQSDTRAHFGLGNAQQIKSMRVTWPDGKSEDFGPAELNSRINTTVRIQQGRGINARVIDGVAELSRQDAGVAQR